jgi:3-oxoadipate enol-lactonase
MFDHGTGPPLVVIPGVQGRWEWMIPGLRALGKRCRTISYSLCGDLGWGMRLDPSLGFENYLRQLDAVLDRAGIERAAICGVSYGGFIALRYAATRPHRVSTLVLVSAPAPGWVPSDRQRRYIARPWLSTPAFVLAGPLRLWPELRTALPEWRARLTFAVTHTARVLGAPSIPPLMASRVTLQQQLDFAPDCARVEAPALIISGEPPLDRVVPVEVTRTYASRIAGARYAMIERTGHIGMLTRPDLFADLVGEFVKQYAEPSHAEEARVKGGG